MDEEKKKILIAEDEKPLAEALKLKLTDSGFLVDVVYNGKEALKLINQDHYDLMLLDLIMPEKDGFAVLKKMKKMGIEIPVIVVSNLSQEGDLKRAKKLGAKDYLVKSDTPLQEIVEKIKKYL